MIDIELCGDNHGRYYAASIQALRDELNRDAPSERSGILELRVKYEGDAVTLLMDRQNLYLIAVKNFKDELVYVRDYDANNTLLKRFPFGGSHTALGTSPNIGNGHTFTDQTCFAVIKLKNYTGISGQSSSRKQTENEKLGFSFAVVSCAEAARFQTVEDAVKKILINPRSSYCPHLWRKKGGYENTMKKWRKLSDLEAKKVKVLHG